MKGDNSVTQRHVNKAVLGLHNMEQDVLLRNTRIMMCKMRMFLTAGPYAIRLMSLQMCACTVNGTVVRGHSKWETGENSLENRPE